MLHHVLRQFQARRSATPSKFGPSSFFFFFLGGGGGWGGGSKQKQKGNENSGWGGGERKEKRPAKRGWMSFALIGVAEGVPVKTSEVGGPPPPPVPPSPGPGPDPAEWEGPIPASNSCVCWSSGAVSVLATVTQDGVMDGRFYR